MDFKSWVREFSLTSNEAGQFGAGNLVVSEAA